MQEIYYSIEDERERETEGLVNETEKKTKSWLRGQNIDDRSDKNPEKIFWKEILEFGREEKHNYEGNKNSYLWFCEFFFVNSSQKVYADDIKKEFFWKMMEIN